MNLTVQQLHQAASTLDEITARYPRDSDEYSHLNTCSLVISFVIACGLVNDYNEFIAKCANEYDDVELDRLRRMGLDIPHFENDSHAPHQDDSGTET